MGRGILGPIKIAITICRLALSDAYFRFVGVEIKHEINSVICQRGIKHEINSELVRAELDKVNDVWRQTVGIKIGKDSYHMLAKQNAIVDQSQRCRATKIVTLRSDPINEAKI